MLGEKKLKPNPDIDNTTFLRRVCLDIIGRIPTLEEAEDFHADPDENRRKRLIEKLLNSEGYVSHHYNFWADILRINSRLGINETPPAVEYAYRLWIKDSLRKNTRYDAFVRELVSARGHFWENGAIGYYQRDRGMPLDNMSNTVRIFLGTRLECAQCHDHPFDDWTQMDYYRMAAFSYGMESKGYVQPNREAMRRHLDNEGAKVYASAVGVEGFPEFSKVQELDSLVSRLKRSDGWVPYLARLQLNEEKFVAAAKRGIEAVQKFESRSQSIRKAEDILHVRVRYVTTTENQRTLKLPHDYQYPNAKPFDVVTAKTMFGRDIALQDSKGSPIDAYAKWMTSRDNPAFTRVIANRLWKKLFGQGVIEPVDELTDHTDPSNPELMAYLEELMRSLNYDMKAYLGVLCRTRAYQRAASTEEPVAGAPCYFQGPALRRMSAEQIWDSVVGLVLPDADSYSPNLKRQLEAIDRVRTIYQSLAEISPDDYISTIEGFDDLMTRNRTRKNEVSEQRRTAHAEMNDELFRQKSEELSALEREFGKMVSSIQNVRQKNSSDEELLASFGMAEKSTGNGGKHITVVTRRHKPGFPKPPQGLDPNQLKAWRARQTKEYKDFLAIGLKWARASELDSPAPRGHFLREFGQSDREVIDNAAIQASVPQALNLLNGPVAEALANGFGVFGRRLRQAKTREEKTSLIFQAMLTRRPTPQELKLVEARIEKQGETAYADIVWALLNSRQFLFIQ